MGASCHRLLLWTALLGGIVVGGCDQGGGGPRAEGSPPVVSDLVVRPGTTVAAELPADQLQDSVAQVELTLAASVRDRDEDVARVEFVLEPSLNPRGAVRGRLQPQDGLRYGRRIRLRVPSFVREVYTVRVFAVDRDSLASNQALGQFRFLPSP